MRMTFQDDSAGRRNSGSEPQLAVRRRRPLSSLAGSIASDVPFPGIEEEKAAVRSLRSAHATRKYRVNKNPG